MRRELMIGLSLSGAVLAGCGDDNEASTHSTGVNEVLCTAIEPDQWTPMPPNINAEGIAETLGVAADQVREGKFGGAMCAQGITMEQIDSGESIISVEGISETCMAIGILQDQPPEANTTYHDFIVVCADTGLDA